MANTNAKKTLIIAIAIITLLVVSLFIHFNTNKNTPTFTKGIASISKINDALIAQQTLLANKQGLLKKSALKPLIKTINDKTNTLESRHQACAEYRNTLTISIIPEIYTITASPVLMTCRMVTNRIRPEPALFKSYIETRFLLKSVGWREVIKRIENGEISIDITLKKYAPKMNLLYMFVGSGVTDIEAYENLINYGVELNAMHIELAMSYKQQGLIEWFYQQNLMPLESDMLQNPITLAAEYGNIAAMQYFVEQGINTTDSVGRDAITTLLNSRVMMMSQKNSDNPLPAIIDIINNSAFPVTNEHLSLAQDKQLSSDIIEAINRRL